METPESDNSIVHLIDDDAGVRDSLTLLLTEAGFGVRSYASGTAFLDSFAPAASGCIVSDIRMPGLDGLELQQKLNARDAKLPIIFITGHADVPMAVQALRAGALDFLEKPFDEDALLDSIKLAIETGKRRLGQESLISEVAERLQELTPRESEVLEGLVAGNANKIIAFNLGMSMRTVEVHRARIMQKMKARSLSELVRLFLQARPS